ncbi:MAG: exodeoxyribonuclease VII large subunit [Synergistaceae bacterium]|nr:exodeoxyribonuclease VII large subunit [Synergistaceae bacterium]
MYKVALQSDILTVDEMTEKVRLAVCSVPELRELSVRGELQGFKRHSSGHVYFTLLGKNSRVSCVLWRSQAASVLSWPKDGDEVLVRGRMDVYGAYGSYQIYASTLLPLGAGAKARAKAMLQKKLEAEGLFDPENKKEFPKYPERVAVITSPTGAALQDVLRISAKRWPSAEIIVIPSLMQGMAAAEEITSAFAKVRQLKGISAVMLVRGGGSRDDLDVFDDERVVRAVSSCPFPVVTGLGHQIDSTLCDLAADSETPTPSGAAEFLFPDAKEVIASVDSFAQVLFKAVNYRLDDVAGELDDVRERVSFAVLKGCIAPLEEKINAQLGILAEKIKNRISAAENRLMCLAAEINAVSPLNVLAKGYTLCLDSGGRILESAEQLSQEQRMTVQFYDGRAETVISKILKKKLRGAE